MEKQATELTRWTIHGERVVDDTRRARLSIAEVELPDGVRFEQIASSKLAHAPDSFQ